MVVETLQPFVKRKIPIRFGIVPLINSERAAQQATIIYHLLDTYGLSAVIAYLEKVSICQLFSKLALRSNLFSLFNRRRYWLPSNQILIP